MDILYDIDDYIITLKVLSIPVLLLACSEDWTCNLQIIVSFRSLGNQRL